MVSFKGMKTFAVSVVLLLGFIWVPAVKASATLPPEVELDLALRKLETSIETGEWSQVQKTILRLEGMDIKLPPVIEFYKAKAEIKAGTGYAALEALERYFAQVDNTHGKYQEALDQYNTAKAIWEKTRAEFESGVKAVRQQLQRVELKLENVTDERYIFLNKHYPFDTIGGTTWEEMETGNLNRCIRIMNERYHEANTKLEAKQYPKSEKKACKKGWESGCTLLRQKNFAVYGHQLCTGEYKSYLTKYNREIKELRAKKAKQEEAIQGAVDLLENEYKEGRF
ncbi:hypothetical protein KFE96_06210 [Kordiimonas sp. SCSIO 12603]|uniref:hypothetical protein n=1 Tax=Kordiimonas sp. SCSIO 12603 TaxID=2829596 RepID=UPI0021060063|nr:hypothetical protein [Kordiimonas sp. SCSIO 12603]UTW59893.1 hypothetical protein KFE96_06210 [Kordiimonas sp. SCSIO 12603]